MMFDTNTEYFVVFVFKPPDRNIFHPAMKKPAFPKTAFSTGQVIRIWIDTCIINPRGEIFEDDGRTAANISNLLTFRIPQII